MSIASEITRIKGKVADSFTACRAKGATIPESEVIANLPTCIDSIPTGSQAVLGTKSITANGTYNAVDDSLDGYSAVTVSVPTGGDEPVGSGFRVRFIDYEGTILKTEYVESGNNATPPTLPTHDNLTFQAWNGAYTNITATRDLSAHYTTTDKKIYLTLEVNATTGLDVRLNFTGSSSCMWGDGNYSSYSAPQWHTYASAGRYTVVMTPYPNTPVFLGDTNTGVPFIAMGTTNRTMAQSLIKVHLGGNVSLERKDMFSYSSRLTEVNIPSSIASIGGTFADCYSLNHITIPSTLTALPTYLFSSSKSLKSYVVPDNITSIGNSVFSSCSNLTEVVLPSGVMSIGNYAFSSCSSLKKIVLPSGLTTIGTNVFSNCYSLEEIIIPSGISTIQANTFLNCSNCKKYVILNDNGVVTLSATNAFSNINYDAKIYVPDALVDSYKDATNWAFYADYIYPISEME